MCQLCDLESTDKNRRRNARFEVEGIIQCCDVISTYYTKILHWDIKPHTDAMLEVVGAEKMLVRKLIMDVL